MLKLFANRGKGSVTVFVTLIMIPTIFFTAFLGDLARIKLYGNIALMTADNFGEDMLTEYDDLLRELYGFFAVTQDKEALQAVETLQKYSVSSFNPNDTTISYKYLQAVTGTKSYKGFAPYKDADVNVSYKFVDGAVLNNDVVFATQLGDFMKFRIVQQLIMSGDIDENGEVGGELLGMKEEVEAHKDDGEAMIKQQEFAEELQEYLDLLGEYYDTWYLIEEQYPKYRKDYETLRGQVEEEYEVFIGGPEYTDYYDYKNPDNKEAIEAAIQKRSKGEEALSAEEQHWCDISDNFDQNEKAVKDFLDGKGTSAHYRKLYEDYLENEDYKIPEEIWTSQGHKSGDDHHVNADNYDDLVENLDKLSSKISAEAKDVVKAKNELQGILDRKNDSGSYSVSEEIRTSLQKNIKDVEDLVKDDKVHMFKDVATALQPNIKENENFVKRCEAEKEAFETLDELIEEGKIEPDISIKLDKIDEYKEAIKKRDQIATPNFVSALTKPKYKELYTSLSKGFNVVDNEAAQQAEENKEEANGKSEGAEEEINKEDTGGKGVRDIPKSYDFGGNNGGNSSSLSDMIKKIGKLISNGGWGNAGNEVLLKLYTIEYDYGMFSSRVTEVRKEKEKENKEKQNFGEEVLDNATGTSSVTLTGYEKNKAMNYMYGAELEYIINGDRDAQDNLDYCRNIICGFRMIMNLASSFSISEVNSAIQAICKPINAIPYVGPALAIIVEVLLRFGFAALETAAEWQKLLEGEKVLLYKKELKELDCINQISSWFGLDVPEEQEEGFGFTYEQYLFIMLMFMTSSEKVFARTENLVELNMNAVIQEVGADGTLKDDYASAPFKMSNAHTAIESTCSVHMDFALIPDGFAKAFLGAKTDSGEAGVSYEEVKNFEKTIYEYTIVRGY